MSGWMATNGIMWNKSRTFRSSLIISFFGKYRDKPYIYIYPGSPRHCKQRMFWIDLCIAGTTFSWHVTPGPCRHSVIISKTMSHLNQTCTYFDLKVWLLTGQLFFPEFWFRDCLILRGLLCQNTELSVAIFHGMRLWLPWLVATLMKSRLKKRWNLRICFISSNGSNHLEHLKSSPWLTSGHVEEFARDDIINIGLGVVPPPATSVFSHHHARTLRSKPPCRTIAVMALQ